LGDEGVWDVMEGGRKVEFGNLEIWKFGKKKKNVVGVFGDDFVRAE